MEKYVTEPSTDMTVTGKEKIKTYFHWFTRCPLR